MSDPASIYLPKAFAEHDLGVLHDLVDAYAFGMLVAPATAGGTPAPPVTAGGTPAPPVTAGGTPAPPVNAGGTPAPPAQDRSDAPGPVPMIAHLPFVLDRGRGPRGTLLGHVARANPILHAIEAGAPVVAVFRGPHGYVSPNWYATRDEVPTWNYAVVHAQGRPRVLDDAELLDVLARLAAVNERGQPSPWTLDDLTPQTMGELFPAIAGFAIEITAIEGKLKLSQNRRPEDREGAIRGLRERGSPDDAALVAIMTRRAP